MGKKILLQKAKLERNHHTLSPTAACPKLGATLSRTSSQNRIPLSRNTINASSDKMYVRFARTIPGEWRSRSGKALNSSSLVS